ncbi:hypothetical protein SLA2020_510940 [Shorea laevis]
MGVAEGTAALAPRNTDRRIGICSRRHQEFTVLVSKYLILTLTRGSGRAGRRKARCPVPFGPVGEKERRGERRQQRAVGDFLRSQKSKY